MPRRSGGRRARRAERAAPLAEAIKPVRPGHTGGQYRPLSEAGMAAIVDNAFRILAEVGFADATPHCIETCTAAGAVLGEDGRLRMPGNLVERTLEQARRNLVLHGQDPRNDLDLSGARVHFSTAGAAVMVADTENNLYRDSLAQDLYDMARIVDSCEHIHMFQRTCVPRDIPDNYEMDVNTLYCSVMGTSKHVGSSWTLPGHVEKSLEMLHLIAGGEDLWRARPFVSQSNCFVVPPMKFAIDALECLRVAVEGGMPVLLLSAGQAGATTPAYLAGAVSQAWAECLGGLVYVNAIRPGAPAILGAWPFVSDLRTGAMSGGSPEQGLLSAACAQIGIHFDLPFGTACGMTDSKFPDFQAGAERAATVLSAALSGANIVYESAGMYASLLGTCPESLLLDNDVLGAIGRVTRGIEVNSDTLSFAEVQQICFSGEGHYLGSGNTLQVMQSEYIYPDFGDRNSPTVWEEQGKPVPLHQAVEKTREILAQPAQRHVADEIDALIRSEFPILLSPAAMGR
ncbi:MAG: trimethylamine methyltransferase family protein [Gammaproteobacteria bacterium]|nr:trimethylamine methyltransferase family protein [Gammaproteobacteria bacterium]MDE0412756.1 trimethylamine methyltransferase family protein [Gammaproteobacteria bacterium]